MSTFTLKALSAVAVLKSKISIPPNQIPHTLNEDLRNLNTMCKLMREELEIMGKLKDVEKRSLIATFNCLLYVNMYEDLHTDDEEFRDYIYMKLQTYEMEVDECSSELKLCLKETTPNITVRKLKCADGATTDKASKMKSM